MRTTPKHARRWHGQENAIVPAVEDLGAAAAPARASSATQMGDARADKSDSMSAVVGTFWPCL
eukprot:6232729-Pyramimonas_sp.AAC.1